MVSRPLPLRSHAVSADVLRTDKSKQALSPRDTDLIEITLSTIFAIDKLLHLLRHRRRSLALLRFRLQCVNLSSDERRYP